MDLKTGEKGEKWSQLLSNAFNAIKASLLTIKKNTQTFWVWVFLKKHHCNDPSLKGEKGKGRGREAKHQFLQSKNFSSTIIGK